MFKKLFGKEPQQKPLVKAPEILGFRLGGAMELDQLKIRVREPQLIVQGMASTQLIQAVGEVKLDENSTLLRYYTDDEGYVQILLTGGRSENHVSDVKLWYYYATQAVGSERDWNKLLDETISQSSIELEGHTYERVWEGTGASSPPVAMTETTHAEEGGAESTDQFTMLYQREIEEDFFEYVLYAGEEKLVDGQLDRCFVISTGFDLGEGDFQILG